MKKFVLFLLSIIASLLIVGEILDFIYTRVYYSEKHPHNKISWLKSFSTQDTFSFVLLGSSRCLSGIDPKIIKMQTGKQGINLGDYGYNPFEVKLMTIEVLKQVSVKSIFIQIDHSYNLENPDNLAIINWMPYIREKEIFTELTEVNKTKFTLLKQIPFYRYAKFDSKIGFRELFLTACENTNPYAENMGFVPVNDMSIDHKPHHVKIESKDNRHIREIIELCQQHHVKVYFFTAPYFNTKVDNIKHFEKIPEFHDFSNSINKSIYFSDYSHLNKKGAEHFTRIFTNYYFQPRISQNLIK